MTQPQNPSSDTDSPAGWKKHCIVCGTDFSARAAEAANTAAALAERLDTPLLLVHSMSETLRDELPAAARDALLPKAREAVGAEAQRLRKLGARVEEAVLKGVPDEGINEFARRSGAGLIVFGCPEGALRRWLTGSVAEVVAESSSVPTLMVHSAAPFEAWLQGARPLRVFVAADFSEVSDAAIRWVREWRRIGSCEVVVADVDWPPEEARALGIGGAVTATENPPEVQQALERNLREKVRAFLGEENVEIQVRAAHGPVARELLALANEARSDLIVVGTHQRHGIERLLHPSVSRAVLRHSPVSVACVPSAGARTKPEMFASR